MNSAIAVHQGPSTGMVWAVLVRRRCGCTDTATGAGGREVMPVTALEGRVLPEVGINEHDADLLSGLHAGAVRKQDQCIRLRHGMELVGFLSLVVCAHAKLPHCRGRLAPGAGAAFRRSIGSGPAAVVARTTRRCNVRCPASMRRAGRTNSSKLTMADTGFPGRPNTGVPVSAEETERQRLGWPDGDLHPSHRAATELFQHHPHQVQVAHADAPTGDDGVACAGALRHGLQQGSFVVPDNAKVDAVPAFSPAHGQQGVSIGIADLARRQGSRSRKQLIPSREDADPWCWVHKDGVHALIGHDPQVGRSEHGAGGDEDITGGDVTTRSHGRIRLVEGCRRIVTCASPGADSVSSSMQTASAPGGMGAPVMMRAAWPGPTVDSRRMAGHDGPDHGEPDRCVDGV